MTLRVNSAKIPSLTSDTISSLTTSSDANETDLATLEARTRTEYISVTVDGDTTLDFSTYDSSSVRFVVTVTLTTNGNLIITNFEAGMWLELHFNYHASTTCNLLYDASTVVTGAQNKSYLIYRDTKYAAKALARIAITPSWKALT